MSVLLNQFLDVVLFQIQALLNFCGDFRTDLDSIFARINALRSTNFYFLHHRVVPDLGQSQPESGVSVENLLDQGGSLFGNEFGDLSN